jgi:hypothetical protein
MTVPVSSGPALTERPRLHLLGGPYVVTGTRRIEIPEGSQRLLVFVALNGGRTERKKAAGMLWPSGDDYRAAGNLRSALWRLKRAWIRVLRTDVCADLVDARRAVIPTHRYPHAPQDVPAAEFVI